MCRVKKRAGIQLRRGTTREKKFPVCLKKEKRSPELNHEQLRARERMLERRRQRAFKKMPVETQKRILKKRKERKYWEKLLQTHHVTT